MSDVNPSGIRKASPFHRFLPLIALILFAVALWVLHDAVRHLHYHLIIAQIKSISIDNICAAIGFTTASYLVMTGYDHLGLAYLGKRLQIGRVTLASFVSYAFSNSIGFSLLASASVRYRYYTAWGLSASQIARLVAFTVLTFWLGILLVAGVIFFTEPLALPILSKIRVDNVQPIGCLFLVVIALYLLIVALGKKSIGFGRWQFELPTPKLAVTQLLVGAIDWMLAGSVLFVLLPPHPGFTYYHFLAAYLLAQIAALLSHVPSGIGVFESVLVFATPGIPKDVLLGSIVIYRGVYYLLPLAIAALVLAGNEIGERMHVVKSVVRKTERWWGTIIPSLSAATILTSGTLLLFSGATPTIAQRGEWLYEFLPLSVIELSHFLGSLVGACLLLLARGLMRRIDAAYVLTLFFLAAGCVFSLLKGVDYEEALFLAVMLAALLPCRKYFFRQASLFQDPLSIRWSVLLMGVLASSIWLGIFSYRHVHYSAELWWQFALDANAPRFLRAAVGATAVLLMVSLAGLLRTRPKRPGCPTASDLSIARKIIAESPSTSASLALLGDKSLLFNEEQSGFVMYGVDGRSWVALGNPVGEPDVARELAWRFREMVERHGGQTVFYCVDTSMLHVYLDMGLTLFKLGENAGVPLADFSLEGAERKGLRYTHRRFVKEGCLFEVLPLEAVGSHLQELKRVSDEWLNAKNTREKGFSLGYFDEEYLRNFPIAVARLNGTIVAFANLWLGPIKQELSFDLMRFSADAPKGIMEYLFVCLMLWGKEQGYRVLDLGMAPLSGLESRDFAPLWNRAGAMIFQHGEHFYNFEGLREYKEKFHPVWSPRYLVCPGGLLTLPYALLRTAALIGGGFKGVVGK